MDTPSPGDVCAALEILRAYAGFPERAAIAVWDCARYPPRAAANFERLAEPMAIEPHHAIWEGGVLQGIAMERTTGMWTWLQTYGPCAMAIQMPAEETKES